MAADRGLIEIEAFAERPIFQIAVVVRDFDAALARYSAVLHTGRWRTWTFGSNHHVRTDYRGRPNEFSARLALNDQTPQLELIQPLEGASTHRDWLEERGKGVHHLGVVVDSVPDAIDQAERAGYEVVQSGFGIGPGRDGAWAYFDTSAALGVMVEAVELTSAMPPEDYAPRGRQGAAAWSARRSTGRC
jgi:methylmalonyl-CoA/ethylmalonyl-CoA epimerase